MESEVFKEQDQFTRSLKGLEQVRRFSGPTQVFWQSFLASMAGVAGARVAVIAGRTKDESGRWKRIAIWPESGLADSHAQAFLATLESSIAACVEQGHVLNGLNSKPSKGPRDFLLAVRLDTEHSNELYLAAFLVLAVTDPVAEEALCRLRLVAPTQSIYHWRRIADQAQTAVTQYSSVLDLLVLLNAEPRFLAVAMTFSNELAARLKCDRVSLGWLQKDYIRIQAISHMERFEKKMQSVKSLELAMEESLDQDEPIIWPPPAEQSLITRDHESYAREQIVKQLCSVPIRLDGKVAGVLTCERNAEAFTDVDLRMLSLCADMSARRLGDLKRHDRWFGARFGLWLKEKLGKLVGVEHTWAKVLALLITIAIFVLFFGKMTYRVEAPFILRTDDIALISAPFNGFIEDVNVKLGDEVNAGDMLLALDKKDLLLEEAGALADLTKLQREAEKARAAKNLAEMRIAEAQADQSRARLDLVRYRLQQSELKAPFHGVVVEGDLKKRIGAPVQQGDLLFRFARADKIYVECDVNEKDIHEVSPTATGEIAFASQPKLKFPIKILRIEPAAQSKQKGNVFVVRCATEGDLQPWWRPGMSGIAKLNVGKRTFFWIITHRTVDFLRMYFWW